MIRNLGYAAFIAAAIAGSPLSGAAAAPVECLPIGGLGMLNFVPENDGTMTIVAALTGSVASATGTITDQRETPNGLEMDMEHFFMSDDGGFMHTKDVAVLSRVAGRADRYMIEITYDVQEPSTSGPLEGYGGQFKSYGLVDLENRQGLIRYSGEICR